MEENTRKAVWVLLACAIIGIGFYIIFYGFMQMQDAIKNNPEVVETTINGQPMLSSHTTFDSRNYDFPQRVEKNGWVHNIGVQVGAVPSLLCAGDKISFVTMSGSSSVDTDVKQIYILFIDSRKQVQQSYNFTEAQNEIENSILSNTPVIELSPKTNQSYEYEPVMIGTQSVHLLESGGLPPFSFSNVGDKIVQIFLLHSSNGRVESKLDTVPIFTVSPSPACLQVTTERDTINEIRLQKITDADIVGLSVVAIGVGTIVMGFDILLRIFLEPYTVDMKDKSWWKPKFTSSDIH